jgi:hypothetical protein
MGVLQGVAMAMATDCYTPIKCMDGNPKVSPGPAMPYPSTPYRRTTPETALQPFQGWPAYTAGSLRPSSTSLDTPRRTPIDRVFISYRVIFVPKLTFSFQCWRLPFLLFLDFAISSNDGGISESRAPNRKFLTEAYGVGYPWGY